MARGFGGTGPVGRASNANIVIFAGVLLSVAFVVIALVLLNRESPVAEPTTVVVEKEAPIKMVDVLVPVSDIMQATPLEPGMFRKESRPQVGVDPRALKDFEEIKGHFARSLMIAGQPIHKDLVTTIRPANELTANIPEGYRAVTIRVDARTSVEGFTRPGARVDVYWTSTVKGKPTNRVIVQNAKVLSAERQTDANSKPGAPVPSTVTLLVSARDAAKINLATTTGSIGLSLRGDTDSGRGEAVDSVSINDLYDADVGADPQKSKEGSVTIGGKKYNLLRNGEMVPAVE